MSSLDSREESEMMQKSCALWRRTSISGNGVVGVEGRDLFAHSFVVCEGSFSLLSMNGAGDDDEWIVSSQSPSSASSQPNPKERKKEVFLVIAINYFIA